MSLLLTESRYRLKKKAEFEALEARVAELRAANRKLKDREAQLQMERDILASVVTLTNRPLKQQPPVTVDADRLASIEAQLATVESKVQQSVPAKVDGFQSSPIVKGLAERIDINQMLAAPVFLQPPLHPDQFTLPELNEMASMYLSDDIAAPMTH